MKGICKNPVLRIYQIAIKNYKLMVFIDNSSNDKKDITTSEFSRYSSTFEKSEEREKLQAVTIEFDYFP